MVSLDDKIMKALKEDKVPLELVRKKVMEGGSLNKDDIMSYLMMRLKDVKPEDIMKALKRLYKLGKFGFKIGKEIVDDYNKQSKGGSINVAKKDLSYYDTGKGANKAPALHNITGGALSDLISLSQDLRGYFDAEEVKVIIKLLIESGLLELTKPIMKQAAKIAKGVLGGAVKDTAERIIQLERRKALPFIYEGQIEKIPVLQDRLDKAEAIEMELFKLAQGGEHYDENDPRRLEAEAQLKEHRIKMRAIEKELRDAEKMYELKDQPDIKSLLEAEEVSKIRSKIHKAEQIIKGQQAKVKKPRKASAKMLAWRKFIKGIKEGEIKEFNNKEYIRMKGRVRALNPA